MNKGFCQECVKLKSWSAPGLVLKGFGRLPGASWVALGRSWAALGRSWAPLGRVLGASWVLLGPSWLPTAAQDGLGLDFSSVLLQFWLHLGLHFGGSRLVFGTPFGIHPLDLHDALFSAGNPCWHSLGLFVSPLQRGGTCAVRTWNWPKWLPDLRRCPPKSDLKIGLS